MAVSSVFAFWAVAILLIVVPGPDWAFTLSAGLRGRSIVPAVSGLVLGYAAITVVVAAGVGALVAGSPATLTGLTIIGGLYLMWHGAMTVVNTSTPSAWADGPARTDWQTLAAGVGASGLNPKGLLILIALLPQFTDPHDNWPMAVQVGVLGLTFTLTCAVFYLCLGSLARAALNTRPAAARAISRLSGAAMIVIGGTLLADRLTG